MRVRILFTREKHVYERIMSLRTEAWDKKHVYLYQARKVSGHVFGLVWFMVINVTINNISVKSWRSDLLVEETGVPG